jgi:hypothetical protein
LSQQPSGIDSQEASKLLETLKQPVAPPAAVAPVSAAAAAEVAKPAPVTTSYIRNELLPPAKWMPPDVDESMPMVESGAACPLPQIQDEVAKRVRGFVDGVNRISATEALEHEVVDRYGLTTKHETRNFTYVESLQEVKPGMYRVEEYRNGTMGLDVFPERLASLGLSMADPFPAKTRQAVSPARIQRSEAGIPGRAARPGLDRSRQLSSC